MSQRQDQQQQQQQPFRCQKCQRNFRTQWEAFQHSRQCKVNNPVIQQPREPPDLVENNNPVPAIEQMAENFYWGEVKGSEITNMINTSYEEIVFWRRNLFIWFQMALLEKNSSVKLQGY